MAVPPTAAPPVGLQRQRRRSSSPAGSSEQNNSASMRDADGNDVGFVDGVGAWAEEQQIQKLSARLQALEADRESMRHAIMSMGAEKAQVVMLKDIAHQPCEEAAPLPAVSLKLHPVPQAVVAPKRKLVKRQPFCVKFFIVTAIKVNSAGLVLL
uniref:Uncharacterized protein n=1 Tax=Aegilops tauschii TaxID=37682 RepID=M8AW28_AEGTA